MVTYGFWLSLTACCSGGIRFIEFLKFGLVPASSKSVFFGCSAGRGSVFSGFEELFKRPLKESSAADGFFKLLSKESAGPLSFDISLLIDVGFGGSASFCAGSGFGLLTCGVGGSIVVGGAGLYCCVSTGLFFIAFSVGYSTGASAGFSTCDSLGFSVELLEIGCFISGLSSGFA